MGAQLPRIIKWHPKCLLFSLDVGQFDRSWKVQARVSCARIHKEDTSTQQEGSTGMRLTDSDSKQADKRKVLQDQTTECQFPHGKPHLYRGFSHPVGNET